MNPKTRNIILVVIFLITIGTSYTIYRAGIIFPQNKKTIYFAPYVNSTHTCYTHASSCTAELKNTEISYIINSSEGSISINGSAFTEANGFFELNLQSNKNYTIEFSTIINAEDYIGNSTFDTYPTGANCITTGKLTT